MAAAMLLYSKVTMGRAASVDPEESGIEKRNKPDNAYALP
jgi:hypothetical protein